MDEGNDISGGSSGSGCEETLGYVYRLLAWAEKEAHHCRARMKRLTSEGKVSKNFADSQCAHWNSVTMLIQQAIDKGYIVEDSPHG